eukprot:TRINITY_DN3497_c0_g1_i1.p1 TRINITY_DN3497_c0_g1~~TRINITY_DN3497_c0_g1_i1.p1  ORF type:complete len:478 (-),score=68.77 TRINITY_DN3497_c0_g1_i1:371-1747(-)
MAAIVPRGASEALREKYFLTAADPRATVNGKRVEMVGMAKIQDRLSDGARLVTVSLRGEGVTHADPDFGFLVPNLTELDVSCCRITAWSDVTGLCSQLPVLAMLDVSCNELATAIPPPLDSSCAFARLTRLVLNKTRVSWAQMEALAPHLPLLKELHLENNGLTALFRETDDSGLWPLLESINLAGNELRDWADFAGLGNLARLHTLVLNCNRLTDIPNPGDLYVTLTSLSLNDNPISEMTAVQRLTHFKGPIRAFRISPLRPGQSAVQTRSALIPHLPDVTMLNGSPVTQKERLGAQRLYLQTCAHELRTEWGVERHGDDLAEVPAGFLARHPQYPSLVRTLHNPLAGTAGSVSQGPVSATITLTLRSLAAASMAKGDKIKKFPPTFTIAQLRLVLQAAFGLSADRQRLVARVPSGDIPFSYDLDDDFKDLQFYCLTDGAIVEMSDAAETESAPAPR